VATLGDHEGTEGSEARRGVGIGHSGNLDRELGVN
jgi:hypothetical protein